MGCCYQYGKGVAKDVPKAVTLYYAAAKLGSTDALYNLGICYTYGYGVERNEQQAAQFFLAGRRQR